MGFSIFMFICNLLIPILMIVTGRIMWKNPPKSINGVYGYRTTMSMKNMDTWKFAHEHSGKLWWKVGWVMLILTILIQLPFMKSNEGVVGTVGGILCFVQCGVLIAAIIPTERALKATFDKNGNRK